MAKVLGIPKINIGRSIFPREFRTMTTMNNGSLYPLLVEDIIPGDTVQVPIKAILRMQTPLYPVMDRMFFDCAMYFIPYRLVWDHFKEYWGENNSTYWEQQTEYEKPQIVSPEGGWATGSLADYMGLPVGVSGYSVSHLPFRCFCQIWNDYYRDENLKQPIFFNKDETTLTGKNNLSPDSDDYITDVQLGAFCPKVAKIADYFTKALPEPLKHDEINLFSNLPVQPGEYEHVGTSGAPYNQMLWRTTAGNLPYSGSEIPIEDEFVNIGLWKPLGRNVNRTAPTEPAETGSKTGILPSNLYADVSKGINTISQLRTAFQLQRYYEAIARSGSRYIEILSGIFGVQSSDARLQRAEFIGGRRFTINMTQVLANTEGTNQHIGSTGGMSQTIIDDYLGTQSFEEHGCLIVVGCLRTEHTYQQGIPRFWLRKKQIEEYNRAFDHITEQPVLNAEIFTQGTSKDGEAFGYQPAFEDMRLGRKIITGEMRSHATMSLDAWHYGDDYDSLPVLGNTWIDEPVENVDRTLSITSEVANQVFGDFVFNTKFTRGMSMYGVPGFMDHM